MSAKSFENRVQQKIEELHLQPSVHVWEEVERRIREKKKRRIIIFWFLFAGIALLGGGAWWMFNSPQQKNLTGNKSVTQPQQTEKGITMEVNGEKQTITNIVQPPVSSENDKTNDKEVAEKQKETVVKERSDSKLDIVYTKGGKNKSGRPEQTGEIKNNNGHEKDAVKPQPISDDIVFTNPDKPEIKNQKPAAGNDVNTRQPDAVSSTPVNKNTDSAGKGNADEPVAEAASNNSKKAKQKKSKWILQLTTGIGSTRLTEGSFLEIGGLKSADAFSIPNTNTGSPAPVSFADSIPLKGANWQIGFNAKRKLGKKTAISAGVSFSYNSAKQRTGFFVDSVRMIQNDIRSFTSGGFYRSGSFNEYTNRYYFIQLPVSLHWQINKGDKLPPLVWENGIAPSFLIGSNALVYDKQSAVFYKDKRVYNSFQLVYQAGLSAELFKNKKHPLTAGLYYNYHISLLQKISPPRFNTLSSFGVKFNWIIKK